MENYYRRLRDLREDHDLQQWKVAEYLGIHEVQYRRYEKGQRDIPTHILKKLARLYNTTIDYILEMTDDPKVYTKRSE